MNTLHNSINTHNLHVWNNAAFDVDTDEYATTPSSELPLQPISTNHSPLSCKRSPIPTKPLYEKPPKFHFSNDVDEDCRVDAEIEEIEKEMAHLSSRLKALRAKKKKFVRSQSPVTKSKRRKWSLPEAQSNGKRLPLCVEEEKEKENNEVISPAHLLPKIRTRRCVVPSPRDSGAAKRVAELMGRRTQFGGLVDSTCSQSLRFEEKVQRD